MFFFMPLPSVVEKLPLSFMGEVYLSFSCFQTDPFESELCMFSIFSVYFLLAPHVYATLLPTCSRLPLLSFLSSSNQYQFFEAHFEICPFRWSLMRVLSQPRTLDWIGWSAASVYPVPLFPWLSILQCVRIPFYMSSSPLLCELLKVLTAFV